MKKILLIATGGTIASRPTDNGLAPELLAGDILRCVPALAELCRIDAVQPMNIDSTNMAPDCWLALTQCLREHYNDYDGFVITHGTDTMAYTACALSYLVQGSAKPIVLTGSQKSIYVEDTDAAAICSMRLSPRRMTRLPASTSSLTGASFSAHARARREPNP